MDKNIDNLSKADKFIKENKIKLYLLIGVAMYIISALITIVINNKVENGYKVDIYESKNVNELEKLLGVTTLTGEGIEITIEDGKEEKSESRTDTIVHDSDILSVINELKSAGAEAIMVNDQRIVNSTAVRCVGPVIQINFKPVASPFVIKAIGNSKYLYSAINIKNGIADILKNAGINVKVEIKDNITAYAYEADISYKYAK